MVENKQLVSKLSKLGAFAWQQNFSLDHCLLLSKNDLFVRTRTSFLYPCQMNHCGFGDSTIETYPRWWLLELPYSSIEGGFMSDFEMNKI